MNMTNACGFLGAGSLMQMLHLLPSVTGVRELWLIVMGAVMMAVGAMFFAQKAWAWFAPRMIVPVLAAAMASRARDGVVVAGRRVEG